MEDKIYVNQSNLRYELDSKVILTEALETLIKYRKPDGTEGSWEASIIALEPTVLYYEFAGGELNVSGEWTLWGYVVFADNRNAPGNSVKEKVYKEGT